MLPRARAPEARADGPWDWLPELAVNACARSSRGPGRRDDRVQDHPRVTTDFSETSLEAFDTALSIARRFQAKILVLYVDEDRLPPFMGDFSGVHVQEILASHQKRAGEELRKLVAQRLAGLVEVEELVVPGIPHREIVRLVEERNVDLIVMATHGRGFIAHTLFGSTAERVVRRASCPVLTVRRGGED